MHRFNNFDQFCRLWRVTTSNVSILLLILKWPEQDSLFEVTPIHFKFVAVMLFNFILMTINFLNILSIF
jgi:hypothetical protein